MFNFKCLNKALLDETLDDNEFRTLYLIANSIALSGEDEITMYNEHIAEKLHITEREVRYRTSSLVKKGYIIKTPIRIGNKKPNKIKLTEQTFLDSDKSDGTNTSKVTEQTFPLYNSTEDKNTSTGNKLKQIRVDFKWLNEQLVTLNKTEDRKEYDTTDNAIANYIQTVKDKLSEKQKPVFNDILNRWFRISDQRDNLFNGLYADATT